MLIGLSVAVNGSHVMNPLTIDVYVQPNDPQQQLPNESFVGDSFYGWLCAFLCICPNTR